VNGAVTGAGGDATAHGDNDDVDDGEIPEIDVNDDDGDA